jgi:hypothetical protein
MNKINKKSDKFKDLTYRVNNENNRTTKPFCLIEGDASRYYNKYVAEPSFSDKKVVAFGEDPTEVFKEARQKGYRHPVMFYVPHPDVNLIF